MPTPTKGPRLGGGPAHERLMLANLATALFEHGKITTTEAKAKRLRPLAERLVTFAKRGDLHARRRVLAVIRDKAVVHTLFTEIGPRYENRPGGYTRITKVGPRKGDNAPMAVIELVEPLAEAVVAEATAATKRATKKAAAPAAVKTVVESTPEVEDSDVVEVHGVETDEVETEAVDDAPAAETVASEDAPAAETDPADDAPEDDVASQATPSEGEKA